MQRKTAPPGRDFSRPWRFSLLCAGVTAGFLGLIGAGCSSKPVPRVKPFEGLVLKVACPPGPAAEVVTTNGKVWSLRTGARVETLETSPEAAEAPAADVWLVGPAALARPAAAGRLQPVPDGLRAKESKYNWLDLLPLYRHKLLVWDRTVYALPFLGEAPLCYFREDLFQDPASQSAFHAKYGRKLGPPATWEEFADIAEFFHGRPRMGAAAPSPSLPLLPETDDGLDCEFYAVAAPLARRAVREGEPSPPPDQELFSFHFDLATGEPRINRPGFVEALRLLQRLQAFRPSAPAPQPAEAFRQGRAVLCLAGAHWLARFQDDQSAVRRRFGVCRVPGSRRFFDYQTGEARPAPQGNRVPYLGAAGLLAVVPRTAAHADAAFDFLAELTGPSVSSELVLGATWGGGVFRREHFRLFSEGAAFGLDPSRQLAVAEDLRQTLAPPTINPVLRLRTPDQAAYLQALAEFLRPALRNRTADPQATLDAIANRWQQLIGRKGSRQHLTDYRLSLSLPPGD